MNIMKQLQNTDEILSYNYETYVTANVGLPIFLYKHIVALYVRILFLYQRDLWKSLWTDIGLSYE